MLCCSLTSIITSNHLRTQPPHRSAAHTRSVWGAFSPFSTGWTLTQLHGSTNDSAKMKRIEIKWWLTPDAAQHASAQWGRVPAQITIDHEFTHHLNIKAWIIQSRCLEFSGHVWSIPIKVKINLNMFAFLSVSCSSCRGIPLVLLQVNRNEL